MTMTAKEAQEHVAKHAGTGPVSPHLEAARTLSLELSESDFECARLREHLDAMRTRLSEAQKERCQVDYMSGWNNAHASHAENWGDIQAELAECKAKLARVEAWMSRIGDGDPYVTDLRAALRGDPPPCRGCGLAESCYWMWDAQRKCCPDCSCVEPAK